VGVGVGVGICCYLRRRKSWWWESGFAMTAGIVEMCVFWGAMTTRRKRRGNSSSACDDPSRFLQKTNLKRAVGSLSSFLSLASCRPLELPSSIAVEPDGVMIAFSGC